MKVLVLAYFFPPQTSVGAFRSVRLVQQLKAEGVEVEVISVRDPSRDMHPWSGPAMAAVDDFEGVPVRRCREWSITGLWRPLTGLIHRLGQWLGRRWNQGDIAPYLWFVDMEYGWIPAALKLGRQRLKAFKPDLIYVSCPPFSSALVANKLARRHGCPYVLDFRDSWLISDYAQSIDRRRYSALQDRLLRDAAALIITTASDQAAYRARYVETLQLPAERVHLIHNAYDSSFARLPPPGESPRPVLHLLYAGAWDNNARSPDRVLRALATLPFDWQLTSVGPTNDLVAASACRYAIDPAWLRLLDPVPKPELLPLMQQADALVLVQGPPSHSGRNTHIAAKTFDYLATGKPIFAVTAEGDNRDFLAAFGEGVYQANANDPWDAARVLRSLHEDWQSGRLKTQPRQAFLDAFEGRHLAARKLALFRQLVAQHRDNPLG